MDLQELLSKIDGEDVKDAIVGLIDAEKERGISSYNKKDSEVLKVKGYLNELGYDKDKFNTIEDFVASVKTKDEKVKTSSTTIAELNDTLNTLKLDIETERKTAAEKTAEARVSKLTSMLTPDISKEFYGAGYMVKDLINSGKVDLVGEKVVFKDGENVVSYDDGMTALRELNKSDRKASQTGGTGDNGGETPSNDATTFAGMLAAEMNS